MRALVLSLSLFACGSALAEEPAEEDKDPIIIEAKIPNPIEFTITRAEVVPRQVVPAEPVRLTDKVVASVEAAPF